MKVSYLCVPHKRGADSEHKTIIYLEVNAMSTYMAKAGQVDRKWYVIDAAGKPLGRVAAQAAVLLRGKHKPTFTPHVDCGDHVIIINCADAVLTGGKAEKKYYYHHTGWIGHLKAVRYDTLMRTKPEKAMELAVCGMIPSNTIGRAAEGRLHVYAGGEHKHAAQKPSVWEL
jgi:large subunit ribosomal protein L13